MASGEIQRWGNDFCRMNLVMKSIPDRSNYPMKPISSWLLETERGSSDCWANEVILGQESINGQSPFKGIFRPNKRDIPSINNFIRPIVS